MNIAIIGLGLIGGSIARCLKKNTPHTVLGMDIDPQVIYKARLLDAIDNELTDERLGICDMVILATWPRAAVEYVQTHADLLKPGAMVSENELAAQLGLSRTPVREALMDMAQYGLVDILPQRGSRISLIDYALVEEARFARQVLEVAILSIVCENVTEESLAQLRQNVRFQQLSQEPGMSGTFDMMELDNEFHRLLFHIAHKDNTVRMLEGMMVHFDRVRALSLSVVKDQKIISDHLAICDAIERRDAAAAQAVMTKHLSRVNVDEATIRAACPEYIKN